MSTLDSPSSAGSGSDTIIPIPLPSSPPSPVSDNDSTGSSSSATTATTVAAPHNKRSFHNSLHLGFSFCLIFIAFSVSQSFQTSSAHPHAGSVALSILYTCFTVSNFVSSKIVSLLGTRKALFTGATTYVAFVAVNIEYNETILYIFSAILGWGASILWTAQGVYISQCANENEVVNGLKKGSTLGYYNGIFFSCFISNMIVGSLLAALLFEMNISVEVIFIVMATICGVGAVTLLGLRLPNVDEGMMRAQQINSSAAAQSVAPSAATASPPTASSSTNVHFVYVRDDESHLTVGDDSGLVGGATNGNGTKATSAKSTVPLTPFQSFLNLFASLRYLIYPRMMVLIPLIIYSGLSQAYYFGTFPPLIQSKSMKFYVLACIGVFDASSSMFLGKASDKVGRMPIIILGFLCSISCLIFLFLWENATTVDSRQDQIFVFFLCGAVLGVSDGVFNTQLYSILGTWFPKEEEYAFANLKLVQAASTAIAFAYEDQIDFGWKTGFMAITLVLGMLSLVGYDRMWREELGGKSVLDRGVPVKGVVTTAAIEGSSSSDPLQPKSPSERTSLIHAGSPLPNRSVSPDPDSSLLSSSIRMNESSIVSTEKSFEASNASADTTVRRR